MKKQNNIENIFKDGLQNFEADPGANAWNAIQSGLSSGAAGSAAAGAKTITGSSWVASIIGGLFIASIAIGGYFFFNKKGEQQKSKSSLEIDKHDASKNDAKNTVVSIPKSDLEVEASEETASEASIGSKTTDKSPVKTTEDKQDAALVDNTSEDNEKTIDEIIAESQAQFEANRLEAIKLEEAQALNNDLPSTSTNNTSAQKAKTSENNSTGIEEGTESNSDTKLNIAETIEFPNAFSPDLDGINEKFMLDAAKYKDEIDYLKVYIYAKTGKPIFEWTGLEGSWDGNFRDGSLAPKGTYFFFAIIKKDNKDYQKKGQFILAR